MVKVFIPPEFEKKYNALLGNDYTDFIECCKTKPPKSIWVNSLKISPEKIEKSLSERGVTLKQLPFHENAFEISGIERPGNLPEFEDGLFNLQEKSSMLPAIALQPF